MNCSPKTQRISGVNLAAVDTFVFIVVNGI